MDILLVDDNEDHAELAQDVLEERDHRVESVYSGEACLEITAEKDFDVVFVDFRMPGMSGLQLIDKLRKAGMKKPIIILTGFGSEKTAIEALKSGAYDYIIKDASMEYLELLPIVATEAHDRFLMKRDNEELQLKLAKKNLQLRRYNEKLEKMVRERTAKLHYETTVVRKILDCLEYGIVFISNKEEVEEINQKAAEILGLNAAQTKGRSVVSAFGNIATMRQFIKNAIHSFLETPRLDSFSEKLSHGGSDYNLVFVPIRDNDLDLLGIALFFHCPA